MNISELGEFGLIQRLTDGITLQNASSVRGVGDDCAVLSYEGEGRRVLVTSDMLLEGVHFDLVYTPLKHLGYKAAVVNFSDVLAMNGKPRQLLACIGLSSRFRVEDVDQLYDGMRLACKRYGVDLVGGDTTASLNGLTLSLTCLGDAPADTIAYRSGAHPNDLICCTGNLGAAYLGLQLLEREKQIFLSQKHANAQEEEAAQPDFAGKEYLIERFLKPEARAAELETLRAAGLQPTAMQDVSDGLSSELLHICKASGVGCRIFEERLPIDYQAAAAAEELNLNPTTCALNGGEDYELLFTLPLTAHDVVKTLPGIHLIGHCTEADAGSVLVTRDGAEIPLRAQGWQFLVKS